MENKEYVFQIDSEMVKSVFNNDLNYLIEYTAPAKELAVPYCIVYFASNEIYYPNTAACFEKEIIQKNKYEWYRNRIEIGTKHIFIRDITKQWYLNGINTDLNSIEKVLAFLQRETEGYRVITIGSSAGGYAAVLFGSLLKAEKIFSFNGQFELSSLLTSSSPLVDPTIFRQQKNEAINQYYSLIPFIKLPNQIYYFCSIKSDWDHLQLKHIEQVPLNKILFKSSHHGIPFLRSTLPFVINMDSAHLTQYVSHCVFPLCFSFKIEGIQSIPHFVSIVFNKIKKKLRL